MQLLEAKKKEDEENEKKITEKLYELRVIYIQYIYFLNFINTTLININEKEEYSINFNIFNRRREVTIFLKKFPQ